VIVIVAENHGYDAVMGNSAMPYFNQLAAKYAIAGQYYGNTHPSLPNYFVLTTGQTISQDDSYQGFTDADNVVRRLIAAGKSWKCYAESLPSPGYLGGDQGEYAKHHIPFAYISDVINDPSQAANIVSFGEFATDFSDGALPDYAFVVPNQQDNAHDCPAGMKQCNDGDKLASFDNWLQNNLDPFLNSSAFQNSLVIVTWDEAEPADTVHGGGHIATLLISPRVHAGYSSTSLYQHQSTLRLSLEALGVNSLPAAASTAPAMTEFFSQ
jgi:phospholipase C